ncbi:hypothetical protein IGI04_019317, partial [Brassica rapa subsp. trilocularis]
PSFATELERRETLQIFLPEFNIIHVLLAHNQISDFLAKTTRSFHRKLHFIVRRDLSPKHNAPTFDLPTFWDGLQEPDCNDLNAMIKKPQAWSNFATESEIGLLVLFIKIFLLLVVLFRSDYPENFKFE